MRKFCFLFLFSLLVIGSSSSSLTNFSSSSSSSSSSSPSSSPLSPRVIEKGEKESISICYGIFYGETISFTSLKFFINYYHNLGVERIVAFLHPSLNQSLSLFQEIGLSITMWDVDYPFDKLPHHQNHKRALDQCISSEINEFGATAIIVCDPDEFLYFNPKEYGPSLQSFLAYFRQMGDIGQLSLSRMYYEIDLCLKRNSNEDDRTLWNFPYTGEKKRRTSGKSIFFSNSFLGFNVKKFEHHFNVTGRTINLDHSKAHFKHLRRFLTWDGNCHVVKNNGFQLQYQEKRDMSDPSHKKVFSSHNYFYQRDDSLTLWRNFVEKKQIVSEKGDGDDERGEKREITGGESEVIGEEKKEAQGRKREKRKGGEEKRPFRKIRTVSQNKK